MVEVSAGSTPAQAPVPATVQRRSPLLWYLIGGLVLLLGGVAVGSWATAEYRDWQKPTLASPSLAVSQTAANVPAAGRATGPGDTAFGPAVGLGSAPTLNDRVAAIEGRLAQLSVTADSMNGNAARAEALLIAFAARRALDRGLALGTLESQLRLRFGDDQPNAVRTVIDAGQKPITLERLQTEFDRISPELIGKRGAQSGIWAGFRRELGELFVVRRADAPSTRLDERMTRAQRLLDAGLVDVAAREVAALPGAAVAQAWLGEAARYHEARRALDLIETAAILAPNEPVPPAAAVGVVPPRR